MADLEDVVLALNRIKDELNFTGKHSAAKVILDQLKSIESRLGDIEMAIKHLKNCPK